ncbi:PiggyBac transposable element-derived protein 4 [Dissostichus eleginoides]|uniref:PiggyBac transposable element-derived protein 4 n=1 Tax=Dissostichus eleginoides TaxID=100907 RepID=A0AAD9B6Y1_DISEL|nr:PiggyBac transposable element-derived protein 4 [Dissostichus eleginoides]
MPSKPAKYGIKSWVACDARSSYAWKMQVYTGKASAGGPEKNQGMRVVLDVTLGLGGGRNVTCDNLFTSYELGQRLLERNITMVGTKGRNVVLLSMWHTGPPEISEHGDKKPRVILDYNRNKGGVDNLDKDSAARWPLLVFHNILDVLQRLCHMARAQPWVDAKRRVFLEQQEEGVPGAARGGCSWSSWGERWWLRSSRGGSVSLARRPRLRS